MKSPTYHLNLSLQKDASFCSDFETRKCDTHSTENAMIQFELHSTQNAMIQFELHSTQNAMINFNLLTHQNDFTEMRKAKSNTSYT